MYQLILFGERKQGVPLQCFKVGLLGCTAIRETSVTKVGGLDTCNYLVDFEDAPSQLITDTLYVTDTGNI